MIVLRALILLLAFCAGAGEAQAWIAEKGSGGGGGGCCSVVGTPQYAEDISGTVHSSFAAPAINAQVGNIIVVPFRYADGLSAPPNTVTDTAGNSFSLLVSANLAATDTIGIFYAKVTVANAADVVQINYTNLSGYNAIWVTQLSGQNATTPNDATGSAGPISSSTSGTTSAYTTTATPEYAICAFSSNINPSTWTAGSGWTLATTNPTTLGVQTRTYSGIQTNVTCDATSVATQNWEITAATFK